MRNSAGFDLIDLINMVIQGLWVGNRLSRMEQLSIASFLAQGHQYHLYIYESVAGIPDPVHVKDAAEIIPTAELLRHRQSESVAVFSDLFRYTLLFKRGGWWVDLDVIALKPFDFLSDYVFATERDAQGREFLTNAVIKAPVQSELAKEACDAFHLLGANSSWGSTGPALLHRLIFRSTLAQYAQSADTFCPIDPFRWINSVLPVKRTRIANVTYAVHLWSDMWRRAQLDKDAIYAPDSLYEQLKSQYLNK